MGLQDNKGNYCFKGLLEVTLNTSTSNTSKYITVSEPKVKTPYRQLSKVVHVKAIQQSRDWGGGWGG